jgi:hypothetical protein
MMASNDKLKKLIYKKMCMLDDLAKDTHIDRHMASMARYAFNILKEIIVENRKGDLENDTNTKE